MDPRYNGGVPAQFQRLLPVMVASLQEGAAKFWAVAEGCVEALEAEQTGQQQKEADNINSNIF